MSCFQVVKYESVPTRRGRMSLPVKTRGASSTGGALVTCDVGSRSYRPDSNVQLSISIQVPRWKSRWGGRGAAVRAASFFVDVRTRGTCQVSAHSCTSSPVLRSLLTATRFPKSSNLIIIKYAAHKPSEACFSSRKPCVTHAALVWRHQHS